MPIYEIACNKCGRHEDVYRKLSDIDDLPDCCGEKMHRCLSSPAFMMDMQPYRSMATGEMITSRSRHKSHMKEHGLIEVGDQMPAHEKNIEQGKKAKAKKESVKLREEISARLDTVTK